MRDLEGKRVLLVDRQIQVRTAITKMLQALNAVVVQAGDGIGALALYQLQSFNAVLTDYDLPDIKGDELAEAIKSIDPGQRVILLTGSVGQFLDRSRLPVRCDAVLSKPCSRAQLSLALQFHTLGVPLPSAN
jgi:CheY-like chemotaxis protein